jgi:hypothetical protein
MVESLVLLEISQGMASFSKNTALMLFCCFRQAERSVHYALSSPSQWSDFVSYYDNVKSAQIAQFISVLKAAGATHGESSMSHMENQDTLSNIIICAIKVICNQFKKHWSFSMEEVSFFCRTLGRLEDAIRGDLPSQGELIDLRMDCWRCHYIIAQRLIGVSAIKKAASIEHFNQSEYIEHIKFEEIVGPTRCFQPVGGDRGRRGTG